MHFSNHRALLPPMKHSVMLDQNGEQRPHSPVTNEEEEGKHAEASGDSIVKQKQATVAGAHGAAHLPIGLSLVGALGSGWLFGNVFYEHLLQETCKWHIGNDSYGSS